MAIRVSSLGSAPVKGMRWVTADELELTPSGPAGDRAFMVVEPSGRLVKTIRTPELTQVEPRVDAASGELTLRFPDGREAVGGGDGGGEPGQTKLYNGRVVKGRLIGGALADALSEHLGRPARILAVDRGQTGADDAPVTLMSRGSLEALADELDGVPDPRRFRMTVTIDGVEAWEEHGWGGRAVTAGDAVLRPTAPVPRCAVTTRDPDDGHRDVPTLHALAKLRGKDDVTFGVWCEVAEPGRVRVGDAVELG